VKWVGLIISLAAIIPLSGWLRRNPGASPKLWMLMGFLPFVLGDLHLYMAIVSWPDWGGYVKGAELSILDVLALTLYLSLPSERHPLPFRFSMAMYFFAASLSAFQAEFPVAALFYPWQLARMFLVYAAVTKAVSADPRVPLALLKGMAAALFMEAGVSIWQRFALGVLQTGGTMAHQNVLGLTSHLIVFPFFALMLAGLRGWLAPAVVLAGVVIEVLTTSRATIGLAGVGYATVFLLCGRRWTSRKTMILLAGAALITILVPLAVSSFEQRQLANDEASSDQERAAYKTSAAMMLSDHPLGVGANHFSLAGNLGGYYDKAKVPSDTSSRSGYVHNIYWLVAAETGYPGIITFVIFLFGPLPVAFRCGRRYRGDQTGDLLLGLGTALLIVYIHSFFESSLVAFQTQYLLVFIMGLVSGIARRLGYWRPPQVRKTSASDVIKSRDKSRSTALANY
jgi:hypothetical protein